MNTRRSFIKRAGWFGLLCAFGLFLLPVLAAPVPKSAPPPRVKAVSVKASIWGSFNYAAWVGHALIQLGDSEPVTAAFADENTGMTPQPGGGFKGTETITMVFPDGSSFQIFGKFELTPASTPRLYYLHEVGTVGNGTGVYEGISGSVVIRGPFLFPFPPLPPEQGFPLWLAEMHGALHLPAGG